MTKKREKGWKKEWLRIAKASTSLAHRTVRCPRLALWRTSRSRESAGDVATNHRTVRWCTGLSSESSVPAPKYIGDELVALGR